MRLHVLHDADGNILAASHADVEPAEGLLIPIPVAIEAGHAVAVLEVASENRAGDLADVCRRHRVDVGNKRLIRSDAPK